MNNLQSAFEPNDTDERVSDTEMAEQDQAGRERVSKISGALRVVGSIALVASAMAYLIPQWNVSNSIERYFILFVQTLLVSFAGFFCGLGLKEGKGARTFLSLVLAVIPVHFAVIGGLVYSQFGSAVENIPNYALWVAPTATQALLTVLVAVVVLTPLSYLSFLSLARPKAKILTLTFVLVNMSMLVPIRFGAFSSCLILVMTIALMVVELKQLIKVDALKTKEGRFARFIMWVPLGIVAVRAMNIYNVDSLFLSSLAACFGLVLFFFGRVVERPFSSIMQVASAMSLIMFWLFVFNSLRLPDEMVVPMLALPISGILMAMSFKVNDFGAWYRRFAVGLGVFSLVLNLLFFAGLANAILCYVISISAVIYATLTQRKLLLFIGSAGIAIAFAFHFKMVIAAWSFSAWTTLAGLGILVIVVGSVMDRYHKLLISWVTNTTQKVKEWEY